MQTTFWGIYCVWLRYFKVFRKSLIYGLVTTFTEPILYLLSFGFGLGSLIGTIKVAGMTLTYKQFVFSGIVAQTVMFQGFFEAAYGSFIRMYYQKVFQALAVTTITIPEILWGEILWDASKASFSVFVILLIGCLTGNFSILGSIIVFPFCFIFAMLFASLGLLVAAKARTIEEISYPQYLFIFPMFLFCGVFFPLETLPKYVQWFAWLLPLTSVASIIRSCLLGLPVIPISILITTIWLIILITWSRRSMINRLVK